MNKQTVLLGAVLLLATTWSLAAGTPDRWVNVHVADSKDNTKVNLRLPLTLLNVALQNIKTDMFEDGKFKLNLGDRNVDFKAIWNELKRHENTDFINVSSDTEDVAVSRTGDIFLVKVHSRKRGQTEKDDTTQVTLRLPVTLLDNLLGGEGDVIDVKSFVSGMGNLPNGDLILVQDGNSNVRIWID